MVVSWEEESTSALSAVCWIGITGFGFTGFGFTGLVFTGLGCAGLGCVWLGRKQPGSKPIPALRWASVLLLLGILQA